MNFLNKILKPFLITGLIAFVISSCNKDVEQFPEIVPPGANPSPGLATVLASSANTLYNAIVIKSGMSATLNDSTRTLTMFVPVNAAVKQAITALTGGLVPSGSPDAAYLGFISSANFTQQTAVGIVSYNTVPQKINYSTLPAGFPNFQYPSLLNPAPTLSALLRLAIFPSKTNCNFVNNVPIVNAGTPAGNGIIYETGALASPPRRYLWDRINTDPDLTYLKAAIARADEGAAAGSTLTGFLQNIGANFTVFAPTDAAFKTTLTGLIYQTLIAQSVPPAIASVQATTLASTTGVFTNPALASVLTPTTVKGIVVYHILGSRAFLNNLPTTQTNFPTLLNGAVAAHPGVGLKVTMSSVMAASATVKGTVNATAANVAVNPTPEPGGSSDQHYLNGVLHKIDQVLLPQ